MTTLNNMLNIDRDWIVVVIVHLSINFVPIKVEENTRDIISLLSKPLWPWFSDIRDVESPWWQ